MDIFGDRMKSYECKQRFMPLLPIIARLDGKNFSRFTKGLNCPYDSRFVDVMIETAKYIVDESNALVAYTQSDEITLIFYSDEHKSQVFFDGKVQKMVSVLSSMATAKFNEIRKEFLPDFKPHVLALFDCRCYQVPTKMEAANSVLWREQDATNNAINMAAHHYFGHKKTMHLNGNEKQEILWSEVGVNFNDYPAYFKRGTFIQRKLVDVEIDQETWLKIPERNRPESRLVKRHKIISVEMPTFTKVTNRVETIFDGEEPSIDLHGVV